MFITHRLKNQKEEITKLYTQKRYQDALDTFRAYFFAKVQLLWNDEKGLVSRDFEGRHGRDYTIKNYEDNVTLLMENIYQARTTKETVHLGEMGALRWDWQPEGLQNPWYIPTVFEYFASEHNFRTLWWKFIDTEDKQYLDKYLEYYDDYTINYRFQENLNPLNLDYGKQGHGNIEHFIHSLSEIARVLPASGKGFPSTTLARISKSLKFSNMNRAGNSNFTTHSLTYRMALCTAVQLVTADMNSQRTVFISIKSEKRIWNG